ncbi:MAG: dTMP kinase [Spirochaetes bacterium]|nr:MAG: dTMP kinase [Spirochaetota bacterium]
MTLRLPLFIAFEGIDGCGKSTLCARLHAHFLSNKLPSVLLREPTDGIWGRKIREMLKGPELPDAAEQVRLFLMDREYDVENNILPAIRHRRLVLMDRYFYSNAAYQGAGGIPPVSILEENVRRGFPIPQRVYLLDLSPEAALERISGRDTGTGNDLFEKQEFLQRVRAHYLAMADERFSVMDGSADPESLFRAVRDDMERAFGA